MQLYPAIDLRGGRVVRLLQGDYERETRYGDAPLAVARRYRDAGATWLHLVDLDGAREGRFTALPVIAELVRDSGLRLQVGGGVRALADVERLVELGVSRVVVGSVAVNAPEIVADWIARFGSERIVVALDARSDTQGVFRLPVKGWTEATGVGLNDWIERSRRALSLVHVLCTDIDRDGMLAGPNVELYAELVARFPELKLQASGGVRDAADLARLAAAGVDGAIIGKALLEGRLDLGVLARAVGESTPC